MIELGRIFWEDAKIGARVYFYAKIGNGFGKHAKIGRNFNWVLK